MEVCLVVVGIKEDAAIVGEIEGWSGRKGGVQTILGAGVELFGRGMVEREHVGYRTAANCYDAKGLAV